MNARDKLPEKESGDFRRFFAGRVAKDAKVFCFQLFHPRKTVPYVDNILGTKGLSCFPRFAEDFRSLRNEMRKLFVFNYFTREKKFLRKFAFHLTTL